MRRGPIVVLSIVSLVASIALFTQLLRERHREPSRQVAAIDSSHRPVEPAGDGRSRINPQKRSRSDNSYGRIALSFEANLGQTDHRVRFMSRGPGYTLFLTGTEAVLSLRKPERSPAISATIDRSNPVRTRPPPTQASVLRMQLVGASDAAAVAGAAELPGRVNYFLGNDKTQWQTNVPTYAKVRYQAVYPGVDLVYYGNQRQLEYDFIPVP